MIWMWLLPMAAATSCVGEDDPEAWSLGPGDALPEFSVTTTTGEIVTNRTFEGKEGYIVFFTTECEDCRRELPEMEKKYRELMAGEDADKIVFICISRAEGAETVEKYWRDNGFTMPVAPQTDREVYDKFASSGIPRMFTTRGMRICGVYMY